MAQQVLLYFMLLVLLVTFGAYWSKSSFLQLLVLSWDRHWALPGVEHQTQEAVEIYCEQEMRAVQLITWGAPKE